MIMKQCGIKNKDVMSWHHVTKSVIWTSRHQFLETESNEGKDYKFGNIAMYEMVCLM